MTKQQQILTVHEHPAANTTTATTLLLLLLNQPDAARGKWWKVLSSNLPQVTMDSLGSQATASQPKSTVSVI